MFGVITKALLRGETYKNKIPNEIKLIGTC